MWSKRGNKFKKHLKILHPKLLELIEYEFDVWQNLEVHCNDCKKAIKIKKAFDQYGYWQCWECYRFDRFLDEEYK
jgi:hypothetical protein